MPIRYYEKHQSDGLYNYYKVLGERQPPAYEHIIFLNERPAVDFSEYDLNSPGSRIYYRSIEENGDPITPAEYEAAYK